MKTETRIYLICLAFGFAFMAALLFSVAVFAQSLPPNTPVNVSWYGSGCEVARVTSCNVADSIPILVYANGVQVGTCGAGGYDSFYSRGFYTDTITLFNTSYTSPTAVTGLTIECDALLSGSTTTDPTPTPILMTPQPISPPLHGSGGPSIPLPSFGGDLTDPNAPVNLWLGFAQDTIDLINSGNLLYIIGAITGAGAVMVWAIQQVKDPKSW